MEGSEGIMKSTEHLRLVDGVAMGRSLVGVGDESVTILVANFSNETRTVSASAKLGSCERG